MKRFVILVIFLFFGSITFAGDITILHTSDIHGRLQPITYHELSDVGGAARQSFYYKSVRKANKNTLILDSGDIFQGSIYYQVFGGKLTAEILKTLNYDAIALGNHEFDKGTNDLKDLIKKSKTQFLCANVEFTDKELQNLIKPYIIKNFQGKRILIIGVTTPDVKKLSNADTTTVYDPSSIIKKIIQENEKNIDNIIIISHCGFEIDKQIAIENPSVNLILGGHNHLFFKRPKSVKNTEIINSGEFGVYVSNIQFSTKSGVQKFSNILMDKTINTDKSVIRKLNKADKKIDELKNCVLSNTEITLIGEQDKIERQQTNLGRLILKSMTVGNNYDIVLTNSGSIRINKNITGNITIADAMETVPFENKIIKGKIKGKYLKQTLLKGENFGRRYLQYYSKTRCFDDEKFYTIITNDYIATGKDGFDELTNIQDSIQIFDSQKEAFINFLKSNKKITEQTLIMK